MGLNLPRCLTGRESCDWLSLKQTKKEMLIHAVLTASEIFLFFSENIKRRQSRSDGERA